MKYYIVAIATIFAMFWDEAMIGLVSIFIRKQISPYFMISWIICSGIFTSLLISYHVKYEYRVLTIVLVSIGVVFSINGYKMKEKFREEILNDNNLYNNLKNAT
jgi:hypothetical protein